MFDFPTTTVVGTTVQVPDGSVRSWDGTKWRWPSTGGVAGPLYLPLVGGALSGLLTLNAGLTWGVRPINAANDAAAAAAGVPLGGAYRNGSVLMVRVS